MLRIYAYLGDNSPKNGAKKIIMAKAALSDGKKSDFKQN